VVLASRQPEHLRFAESLVTWSIVLAAVGIISPILTGRKMKSGWAVAFFTQFLWIAFSIQTHQYGFIILSCFYLIITGRNWLAWRRDEQIAKSSVKEDA
jgi:nicotinamide riboside transporter PnuC